MPEVKLDLRTGEGKRTWYGYIVSVGDWTGDLQFIDRIHYQYLKSVTDGGNASDLLNLDEE